MNEAGYKSVNADNDVVINPELVGSARARCTEADRVLEMLRLIYGNWQTCVTYTFAELGVADLLSAGTLSVRELAAATQTDSLALLRFLRCAAALGFIDSNSSSVDPDIQRYSVTDFGRLLSSEHPMSQRAAAQLNGAAYRYGPWGRLTEVLKAGTSRGISPSANEGMVAYLSDKPDLLRVFHRAMSNLSFGQNKSIANCFDFSEFQHVVDVGGGEGSFLTAILDSNSHLRGTLVDANLGGPEQVGGIHQARFRYVKTDFFIEVPDDGDVYILKNVVHNWPEAKVLALLGSVRAAMASTSKSSLPPDAKRLLIIEHLITEDDAHGVAKWLDLNAMVLVDGAERTLEEYRGIGRRAGFVLLGGQATDTGRHIMEYRISQD